MTRIIVAIHGILTGQTDPSWPDQLDAWMFHHAPDLKVLKKEYAAGPFPRWNCLVRNPRLARSLANELELLEANRTPSRLTEVWLVAHSNGAVIALETARLLIRRGCVVTGLILTGAACGPDIARTSLLAWTQADLLRRAIAYCSPDDRVLAGPFRPLHPLWSWLIHPYGDLGRTGWQLHGRPIPPEDPLTHQFLTRWHSGGHSAWFAPGQIQQTFELFLSDITSATPTTT